MGILDNLEAYFDLDLKDIDMREDIDKAELTEL
jgi:hypothetical protein